MTPTEKARTLLAKGLLPTIIASITGLHPAYVRKIRQRDAGRDYSWRNWRENNPAVVREYRAKQDRNRLLARRAVR